MYLVINYENKNKKCITKTANHGPKPNVIFKKRQKKKTLHYPNYLKVTKHISYTDILAYQWLGQTQHADREWRNDSCCIAVSEVCVGVLVHHGSMIMWESTKLSAAIFLHKGISCSLFRDTFHLRLSKFILLKYSLREQVADLIPHPLNKFHKFQLYFVVFCVINEEQISKLYESRITYKKYVL